MNLEHLVRMFMTLLIGSMVSYNIGRDMWKARNRKNLNLNWIDADVKYGFTNAMDRRKISDVFSISLCLMGLIAAAPLMAGGSNDYAIDDFLLKRNMSGVGSACAAKNDFCGLDTDFAVDFASGDFAPGIVIVDVVRAVEVDSCGCVSSSVDDSGLYLNRGSGSLLCGFCAEEINSWVREEIGAISSSGGFSGEVADCHTDLSSGRHMNFV